jgi:hypothetical protein
LLAKVRDKEIIRFGFRELWELEIHAPNPESLSLQSLNQLRANKPARATNKSSLQCTSLRPIAQSANIAIRGGVYTRIFRLSTALEAAPGIWVFISGRSRNATYNQSRRGSGFWLQAFGVLENLSKMPRLGVIITENSEASAFFQL